MKVFVSLFAVIACLSCLDLAPVESIVETGVAEVAAAEIEPATDEVDTSDVVRAKKSHQTTQCVQVKSIDSYGRPYTMCQNDVSGSGSASYPIVAPPSSYQSNSYSSPGAYSAPKPGPSYAAPSRPSYSGPSYPQPSSYSGSASYSGPSSSYSSGPSYAGPSHSAQSFGGGYRSDNMIDEVGSPYRSRPYGYGPGPSYGPAPSYGPSYAPSYAPQPIPGPSRHYSYGSPAPATPCGTQLLFSCQPSVAPVPCSSSPSYSSPLFSGQTFNSGAGPYQSGAYSTPIASYAPIAPVYSSGYRTDDVGSTPKDQADAAIEQHQQAHQQMLSEKDKKDHDTVRVVQNLADNQSKNSISDKNTQQQKWGV